MPRIVYVLIFIAVAFIPIALVSALSNMGSGGGAAHNSYGYYRRGPTFLFIDLDSGWSNQGRGYSSGSYRGGGFSFGK